MLGDLSFPMANTSPGWSRLEKAGVVAGEKPVLEHLRACLQSVDGDNCGTCEKCVRTKFEFLVGGVDNVPALGGPATAESLSGIKIANGPTAHFWQEILEQGSWNHRREMRAAIETMLRTGFQPTGYAPRRRRRTALRLWWKYFRA
jgi:hypothetical protein